MKIPRVIGSGSVTIGGLEITVFNLDDGTRVIEKKCFNNLLDLLLGNPCWLDGLSETDFRALKELGWLV